MDREYWNYFYEQSREEIEEPSLFAKWVLTKVEKGKKLVDIGCGNGRDSIFFMKNGLEVYSVDLSDVVTKRLAESYKELHVFNEDFVSFLEDRNDEFEYLYSRFTIHAITDAEENRLVKNAYNALKEGGFLFIEVRCTEDELFGKGEMTAKNTYFYNGHNRRFVEKGELEQELLEQGFEIVYSEQKKGLAPFRDMDPIILRLIGRKRRYGDKEQPENGKGDKE